MNIASSFPSSFLKSNIASILIFGVALRSTASFSSSNQICIPSRLYPFTNPFVDQILFSCTQKYATRPSSSPGTTMVTKISEENSPHLTQKHRKSQTINSMSELRSASPLSMSLVSDNSITSPSSISSISLVQQNIPDGIMEVVSSAFLITANTIGPSIMVVPNAMAGQGLIISGILMTGVWMINLLSALLIAEVAINQHEASSCHVPSSFKDFAEINLQSKAGGIFVSFLCIFVNWCVVSFNLIQTGDIILSNLPPFSGGILEMPSIPHATAINIAATLAAVGWTILVGTQTNQRLSGVASLCCLGLFMSFASVLFPGIASVQSNPLSLVAETTHIPLFSDSIGQSTLESLPIFVAVMIFQNIVPTVVKILGYDRKKCVLAMIIGSVVPLLMHLSFSYAVLGGGINLDLDTGGPLLNIFTTISVLGSTMACIMSLSGEFDSHLDPKDDYGTAGAQSLSTVVSLPTSASDDKEEGMSNDIASIPALALAVLPPLLAGIYFSGGEEFVQAISVSGGYVSPLLYGVIPMILAWNQRKGNKCEASKFDNDSKQLEGICPTSLVNKDASSIFQRNNGNALSDSFQELAPGGSFGLGLLGISSVLLMSQNLMTDLGSII